jgi:hypothetical protein
MADRVVFLRPDAERIARVVRRVEGMRETPPLTFRRVVNEGRGGASIKLGTFTGSWSLGSLKTVTFTNQTATPNTASVLNSLAVLPDSGQRACVISKDGTAWHLLNWQWFTRNAVTAVSLTQDSLLFTAAPVAALATSGTSTFSIAVSSCATAQAQASPTQLAFYG